MPNIGRVVTGLVAVVAVSVGLWIKVFGKLEREGPCSNDPLISVPLTRSITLQDVDPCSCFSETYQEARNKFLTLSKAVGATIHSIPIVVDESGEEYTTDIAIIEGDNRRLIVHTSGVHGIEGYAGSAIQLAWLKELQNDGGALSQKDQQQVRRPTMIFIHAINPWGMAHDRRVNENNVDLNRNSMDEDEFVGATNRDPNLAHYQDFHHVFNPSNNTTFVFWFVLAKTLLSEASSAGGSFKAGIAHLKKAMVTGQYHEPKGIFYGGSYLQPSIAKLYETMETIILPQVLLSNSSKDDDETKTTRTTPLVTWIDVHTGLGIFGHDTLLFNPNMSRPQALVRTFPGAAVPFMGEKEGDDVKQGYELTIGMLENKMQKLFQQQQEEQPEEAEDDDSTWIVTQEFGTRPSILVGRALILENRAYHHGTTTSGILRRAFYPQTKTWRREILERGLQRLYQATQRRRQHKVTGRARV